MNEYDEINEWYRKADDILCDIKIHNDSVINIMELALCLRCTYLEGKEAGIHQSNNARRD